MVARQKMPIRSAFSLVEVLVSLTILGFAAAALLLANESTAQSTQDAIAETIARGIAEQIVDDVVGLRYVEPGEPETVLPLGTETGESRNPVQTALFDDTDDYHGVIQNPPLDPWGVALGHGNGSGGLRPADFRLPDSYLSNWRVAVSVTYVNETNPTLDLSGSAISGMRAVAVTVSRTVNGTSKTLSQVRRVFSYVPTLGS